MKALGAGAPEDGAKAEDDEMPLRLPIMLPSMYHIKGLEPPTEWLVEGEDAAPAGAAANAVDVGSALLAGKKSAALSILAVSTVSQENVSSCEPPSTDLPATAAAASQSALVFQAGTDISWNAAMSDMVAASFCTPQAARAEKTTATAAALARRPACTDQVMPVSSISAGALRVRIVLLIVSVYHKNMGLSTDYLAQAVAILHEKFSTDGLLVG